MNWHRLALTPGVRCPVSRAARSDGSGSLMLSGMASQPTEAQLI
jgi:hypothetical protein